MTGDPVYFTDEHEAFRQRDEEMLLDKLRTIRQRVNFDLLAFGRVLVEDVLEEKVAIPPPALEPAPRNRAERRKRWHDMRRKRR